MCGIFGTINCGEVDQKRFQSATELLKHRGPDDIQTRHWPLVSFGFTRLAILDLSKVGSQPMSLSGKSLHIVFNGEIYNFKILRDELIKLGAVFTTKTDTEVILHGYFYWGWSELLNRLEGMFALALYDKNQEIVYLARDRFGQKPLFYSEYNGSGLIFTSEIKAIVHFKGEAQLDFLNSLNPLFTTGLSPRGRTMFKGVNQLPEGSYLIYNLRSKTIKQDRYFRLSQWVSESMYKEISGYSKSKLLQVYDEALADSVSKHLISDAPLASLFSAGLDSSLITAVAARERKVDLYYFESEMLNYANYPKYFANKYDFNLKIAKGNDKDYIFELPRMIYHYETINKEDGLPLGNLCRMASRDGIKVLLTGDASDELFGGQPHHTGFMISNTLFNSRLIRTAMKGINRLFPFNIFKYTNENPLGTDYLIFPPGAHFNEVPLNCLYHNGERLGEWQECLNTYSFISDKLERELQAYMLDEMDYRLQRYMIRSDRFGMMESVEIRTPLLHPAIVKLALNTPTNWKMKRKSFGRGFDKKHIVKQLALKEGLPYWYVYRKKITTPHNSSPQVTKILENWKMTHLAEFLRIQPDILKKVALESFDRDLSRIQYAFLAMEILIRLYTNNETYQDIEEDFRRIIQNNTILPNANKENMKQPASAGTQISK